MGKKHQHWHPPFMVTTNKKGPHPRNIYQTNPDLKELAINFPEFRPFVHHELSGKMTLNYKDREALYALVKLLLKKDFNLVIDLPPDRLVPGITLRLNYILWIEDLLDILPCQFKSEAESVHGIDIGTGASCIYALLAARKYGWKMLGTELDQVNFNYAKRNVEVNGLQEKITVKKVNDGAFLANVVDDDIVYDFCMCNPPFFSSEEVFAVDNKEKDRTGHRPSPKGAKTGSPVELAVPGGEVSFIKSIIEDSKVLREKIKVYTSMMGHRKTLDVIGPLLSDLVGDEHLAVTTFHQGQVTRWGIAWTYNSDIKFPKCNQAKSHDKPVKRPAEYLRTGITLESAVGRVRFLLDRIQITKKVIEKGKGDYAMELKAYEVTWQNQRKRRREEERKLKEIKKVKLENEKIDVSGSELNPSDNDVKSPVTETKDEPSGSMPENVSHLSNSCTDNHEIKPLVLNAIIVLKAKGNDVIIFMSPNDGASEWDSIHQVMTYLKNHWDRDLLPTTNKLPA